MTNPHSGALRAIRVSPLHFLLELLAARRLRATVAARSAVLLCAITILAAMPASGQQGWSAGLRDGTRRRQPRARVAERGRRHLPRNGGSLSFGIEGGYDLFDARTDFLPGLYWFLDGGCTGSECPSPCADAVQVDLTQRRRWHAGPTLRPQATSGGLRPYALLGIGVYGIGDRTHYSAVETGTGNPVTGPNRFAASSFVAPPATGGGGGLEFRPGGGRVGLTGDLRFHVAGRPFDDYFGGAGYFVASGGVTVRL